jgi:hypothetical protein
VCVCVSVCVFVCVHVCVCVNYMVRTHAMLSKAQAEDRHSPADRQAWMCAVGCTCRGKQTAKGESSAAGAPAVVGRYGPDAIIRSDGPPLARSLPHSMALAASIPQPRFCPMTYFRTHGTRGSLCMSAIGGLGQRGERSGSP